MLNRFYELREKYQKELVMAEAKIEVITDLIKECEAEEQKPCETVETLDENTTNFEEVYNNNGTDGIN